MITDHKALLSLLNGNNKKTKTMISRLTIWLDFLIPIDFEVEHKPRAKIISFSKYVPPWDMIERIPPWDRYSLQIKSN